MLLTSEFSAAFRLTKRWHLLAQTGHAAVNGQYSGVAISPIAFATTDASGRNSHYLRCGMRFWLTETLRLRANRMRFGVSPPNCPTAHFATLGTRRTGNGGGCTLFAAACRAEP